MPPRRDGLLAALVRIGEGALVATQLSSQLYLLDHADPSGVISRPNCNILLFTEMETTVMSLSGARDPENNLQNRYHSSRFGLTPFVHTEINAMGHSIEAQDQPFAVCLAVSPVCFVHRTESSLPSLS